MAMNTEKTHKDAASLMPPVACLLFVLLRIAVLLIE